MKKNSFTITIGDISVECEGNDTDFLERLKSKYQEFLSGRTAACLYTIHMTTNPAPRRLSENTRYPEDPACRQTGDSDEGSPGEILRSAQNDTVGQDEDISVSQENGFYDFTGEGFHCRLDIQTKSAGIMLPPEESFFDTFLRVFYSLVSLSKDSFLIHSAGLEREGGGYLFAGPSDNGKTTTAANAKAFNVLNDELMMIKKEDKCFSLCATPFRGEFSSPLHNKCVPLKRLFFLNKELDTPYQNQDQTQTVVKLLENIFFFEQNSASCQKILNLCYELSRTMASYQINIFTNQDIGRGIDDIISKTHKA